MRRDFAVFILSHGRANQQLTVEMLEKCSYSGRLYIIVDDEDAQKDIYKAIYGEKVIVFSKKEIESTFDTMTNQKEYRSVVYARNVCYEIANKLDAKYVLMCDDDISSLLFRVFNGEKLKGYKIKDIDKLFESMIEYISSANLAALGFSQEGAYVGGASSKKYREGCNRLVSQMFLIDMTKKVPFRGIFNEDFNYSIDVGVAGEVALSTMLVSIKSPKRMTNEGGLHDLYVDNGVYVREFYSKIAHPGTVRIEVKGHDLTFRTNRDSDVPKIISSSYRKEVTA